jgi:hypothetical protein
VSRTNARFYGEKGRHAHHMRTRHDNQAKRQDMQRGRKGVSIAALALCALWGWGSSGAWAAAAEPTSASCSLCPDGRVYELVSPPEKAGDEAGGVAGRSQLSVAAADGERVVYGTSGPVGSGPSGLGPTYSVSQRTSAGWQTRGALPRGFGALAIGDAPGGLFYPSPDLSSFAFATIDPYVTPGAARTPNLYLSGEDTAVEPRWVSMPTIANPIPELEGATFLPPGPAGPPSNTGTIYFTYHGPLVPEDAARRVHDEEEEAEGLYNTWGFYEWSKGNLTPAGKLPDGTLDEYGAVPAATVQEGGNDTPDSYANQVSADGSRAFFVSPDPRSKHPSGDPVELYVREHGETVLVSRNVLDGGKPAEGYPEGTSTSGVTPVEQPVPCPGGCSRKDYVYALASGAGAFFESADKLATGVNGEVPTGAGPWTYEFDLETKELTYIPGVSGPILASSAGGSRLLFFEPTARWTGTLYLWSKGGTPIDIANLPEPPEVANEELQSSRELIVAPVRATQDGRVFVFETNAPIPQAKSSDGTEPANNGSGYYEVYRYDSRTSELLCVSCAPAGAIAAGPADLSNDDQSEGKEHNTSLGWLVGNRGMTADGAKVFFDTRQALVPQDVNGVRDVYEWENGKRYLISSGKGSQPSFFLDNSESGRDVFFATADGLVPRDTDGGYDVYDAREGGGFPQEQVASECVSDCQGEPTAPPVLGAPSSATFSGTGNVAPPPTQLPSSPKKKTASQIKAEKLARALKACKKKSKAKRKSCKAAARKRYGPTRPKTHKGGKQS